MSSPFLTGACALSPIAATGDRFSDFAPYVASINNNGVVAFQATLRSGGTGVYTSDGATITTVVESATAPLQEICSHPDLNDHGHCCFYATLASGSRAVVAVRGGEPAVVADGAGPLGPTMNESGTIAFRSTGVFTADGRVTRAVASTGERFSAFHGLPVINSRGAVVFRADCSSGVQGIYVGDDERTTTAVESGGRLSSLGAFTMINDAGTVAFYATLSSGGSGVFTATGDAVASIIDSSGPFETFRGVLIDGRGRAVFYATPRGGSLGIFNGPDPVRDCVLSIGAPLLESTVTEFALNPVSINDQGQLTIRVRLADERQFIVRADLITAGAGAAAKG